MSTQRWGDEMSMEEPATPVGGVTNIGGNGAHINNKGTESRLEQVTFGDSNTDARNMPPDNRIISPPAKTKENTKEANTNPGKGTALPHNTVTWGNSAAEAMDNDQMTGSDGDDNDIAARVVGRDL